MNPKRLFIWIIALFASTHVHNTALAQSAGLSADPGQARTKTVTDSQFNEMLHSIQTADRSNLKVRLEQLSALSGTTDVVPRLQVRYLNLPEQNYTDRLFLMGLIGEYQDPRSLNFLRTELERPLPREEYDHLLESNAQKEAQVRAKIVHAIGYQRTPAAKATLRDTFLSHPSLTVRSEAIAAYRWNSRDEAQAVRELLRLLPPSLHRHVEVATMHRGVNRETFNKELLHWKRKWRR